MCDITGCNSQIKGKKPFLRYGKKPQLIPLKTSDILPAKIRLGKECDILEEFSEVCQEKQSKIKEEKLEFSVSRECTSW